MKQINVSSIEKWQTEGFNKQSSAKTYLSAMREFCKKNEHHTTTVVSATENLTESFIRRNRNTIAPKRLNVIYCAIKHWLWFNRKIKNKRVFREIQFHRTSRKTPALTEFPPETNFMVA